MCGIAVVFGYIEMNTVKYTTYIFYVSQLHVLATSTANKSGWGGTHIKVHLTEIVPDFWQPWGPPSPSTMGNGSFPGIKLPGRGVDRHPHLAPRLKKE